MRKFNWVCTILLLFISFISCTTAQDKERLASIDLILDKMKMQGIDIQQPLLYGYFFLDSDKTKLEKLKSYLLKDKYKFVRLEKSDESKYILHVEKVEKHTRESLLERENHLESLAKELGVEVYDGWDVGNADPTKPLVSNDNFEKSLKGKTNQELFELGNKFYEDESNEKAILVFESCIKRDYKLDTSYYKLGISYISVAQTNLGIEKLEKVLEINPNYYKACYNIGATCYDIEQYQKSINFYKRALKLNDKDDRVYYGIAASQFVLGELNESEINCKMALKLNPKNENANALLKTLIEKRN